MPSVFSRFKYGLAHGHDLLNLSFFAEEKVRKFLLVLQYKRKPISFEGRKKMVGFTIKD